MFQKRIYLLQTTKAEREIYLRDGHKHPNSAKEIFDVSQKSKKHLNQVRIYQDQQH